MAEGGRIRGAGYLRDQVTVKTTTPAADGNAAASTVRTQWCRIEPASGREMEVGEALGQTVEFRLIFRESPVITTAHELHKADGTIFDVLSVVPYDEHQVVYAQKRNR